MELVFWGLLGGCAAEIVRWFRIRDELHKGVPNWAKSWLYWLITSLMVALGGVLVELYQNSQDVSLNELLAFNIGISAPLILTSFTSQVPIDPGTID